jgi:uridine phosphorylase
MSETKPYHLQTAVRDVGYALLPGDPGRVTAIAKRLGSPREVSVNREFTTWSGTLEGTEVLVTSTGIGGPSAAIAVEELCDIGVHTLVRVGTCGALQPGRRYGDVVIAQAAVRDEGTTAQYAPLSWPATASLDVVVALRDAARTRGRRWHVGTVQSKDSFYGQIEPRRMPVHAELLQRREALVRLGVEASEMECAALFTVARARGARAGAVLAVINEAVPAQDAASLPDPHRLPLDDVIELAVEGLRHLIGLDADPRLRAVPS